MIATILTLTSLRFLWSQVKPFFRGKILYTPDTPATRCRYYQHLINIVLISSYPMHCNAIKHSTGRRLVGAVDSSYFRPVESLQAALRHWEETYSEQVAGFVLNRWAFFLSRRLRKQTGMDGKWLDKWVMMKLENISTLMHIVCQGSTRPPLLLCIVKQHRRRYLDHPRQ